MKFKKYMSMIIWSMTFLFLQTNLYASETGMIPEKSIATAGEKKMDEVLKTKIEDILKRFDGDAGVYVRNLKTGQSVAIRADELFPTASMVKVPILISIFAKIEAGELNYLDKFAYDESRLYEGEDILGSFKNREKITLSRLILLMITMSDNTASLWLQQIAGSGTEVNARMEKMGFKKTRVNSRTAGREKEREAYGWGQTTPREMAELLVMIRTGKAISESASEEMYRVLCNIYWNSEALSQIPPFVQAASKSGSVSQSKSEVVLVNGPSADYVFCIMTNNQKNSGYEYENDGFVLVRNMSKLLWEYFERGTDWKPADGSNRWIKVSE